MLGWRWTLLPAWVTKGISEGRRAGEPQLHMEEEAGAPGGLFVSRAVPCPAHHTQPAGCTVPMAAPSVHQSVHPGQGRLVGCYGVCVCVVPLMTTRKIFTLHSNEHPWVCYSTSEHRKTQLATEHDGAGGAASPGGAEAPALAKESLKPTMEEEDGRGYTSQFPFTTPPGGSTEAVSQERTPAELP